MEGCCLRSSRDNKCLTRKTHVYKSMEEEISVVYLKKSQVSFWKHKSGRLPNGGLELAEGKRRSHNRMSLMDTGKFQCLDIDHVVWNGALGIACS